MRLYNNKRDRICKGIIIIILSMKFLIVAATIIVYSVHLIFNCKITTATITNVYKEGSGRSTCYIYIFKFIDENGEEKIANDSIHTSILNDIFLHTVLKSEKEVSILYNPNNLKETSINSIVGFWGNLLLALLVIVIFVMVIKENTSGKFINKKRILKRNYRKLKEFVHKLKFKIRIIFSYLRK